MESLDYFDNLENRLSFDRQPRQTAIAEGKKYYWTGRECRNGHLARRFAVNGLCVKCGHDNAVKRNKTARVQLRTANALKRYGLSVDEYQALLRAQNNKCAICEAPFGDERKTAPHVDHDHDTGTVRGLLCWACNFGLGHFQDCREILILAAAYLKKADKSQRQRAPS